MNRDAGLGELRGIAAATPARRSTVDVKRFVAGILEQNCEVLLAAALFIVAVHAVGGWWGWGGMIHSPRAQYLGSAWLSAIVLAGWMLGVVVRRRTALAGESNAPSFPRAWWIAVRAEVGNAATLQRIASFLIVTQVLAGVMATYTGWKSHASGMQEFGYDATLLAADRLLHFGTDPWTLTQVLLGAPWRTRIVDFVYLWGWMAATVLVPMFVALARPSRRRTQFLLSYVLTWAVLGMLVAPLVPSAGPVYLARIHPETSPFPEMHEYLGALARDVGLWATAVQDGLWLHRLESGTRSPAGISAFPSLHVAYATLLVCAAWRMSRWVIASAVSFWLVIMLGSVHLGWHYAVDGYVSAIVVAGLWFVSGRLAGGSGGSRHPGHGTESHLRHETHIRTTRAP